MTATENWLVGPEYDEPALRRLGTVLKGMGFELHAEWAGIAGSQDIGHWELASPAGSLAIESETYIGLTVAGPADLVRRVRRHFEAGS